MELKTIAKILSSHNKAAYHKDLCGIPARALEVIAGGALDAVRRRNEDDSDALDRPDYVKGLAGHYTAEITAAHTVTDPTQLQDDIEALCNFAYDSVMEGLSSWVDQLIAKKQAARDA